MRINPSAFGESLTFYLTLPWYQINIAKNYFQDNQCLMFSTFIPRWNFIPAWNLLWYLREQILLFMTFWYFFSFLSFWIHWCLQHLSRAVVILRISQKWWKSTEQISTNYRTNFWLVWTCVLYVDMLSDHTLNLIWLSIYVTVKHLDSARIVIKSHYARWRTGGVVNRVKVSSKEWMLLFGLY